MKLQVTQGYLITGGRYGKYGVPIMFELTAQLLQDAEQQIQSRIEKRDGHKRPVLTCLFGNEMHMRRVAVVQGDA